jgi:hypothetical protein
MFSFSENRLNDLRLEGKNSRTVPPEQRLKLAFEFLKFSEELFSANNTSEGDINSED